MEINSSGINPLGNSINVFKEIFAYEALWKRQNISFKKISKILSNSLVSTVSQIVPENEIYQAFEEFKVVFKKNEHWKYPKAIIRGMIDYPEKLLSATEPIEVLYYEGDLTLIEDSKAIAVVGTRNPSPEGIIRTRKLVKELVKKGFTIVSGMAKGIDTIAHLTALENGGKTIAVLGTPIDQFYPKENKKLQLELMRNYLVVSQVPYLRYSHQNPSTNRFFFPERNKTMSALTWGTVIVEASETSGTLVQARAAINQNRKLFILNNCFENSNLTWPSRFAKEGAVRVYNFDDIFNEMPSEWL